MSIAEPAVNKCSPPDAKIHLFRSLFRARNDVYPLRFESRKTGRSGYQPACANEWVRGVCEKPRIKCFDCPNRRFLSITDDVRFATNEEDDDQPWTAPPSRRRKEPPIEGSLPKTLEIVPADQLYIAKRC